ncbi:NIF family HAD-type phosphatase [Sphingomonas sp. MS122]|uniref:NIF family HAD-type phosphatase n=1 Tax=Sphingomonas sp. MS122 TaxID=3412683 RepID=UPI003C2F42EF
MSRERGERILLILDLDETLIHATEAPLERPADFNVFDYHVYRRPYLTEFLVACMGSFELAVWSSASDDYVELITREIFGAAPLHFVWGRSRATLPRVIRSDDYLYWPTDHRHYVKPLAKAKKLGWPLERILIVDDTPEKCVRNYGNAIYAHPFEGDPADDELRLLAAYLETLKDCSNVRAVEKRRWRAAARELLGLTPPQS